VVLSMVAETGQLALQVLGVVVLSVTWLLEQAETHELGVVVLSTSWVLVQADTHLKLGVVVRSVNVDSGQVARHVFGVGTTFSTVLTGHVFTHL
jgi:hypothetical protein